MSLPVSSPGSTVPGLKRLVQSHSIGRFLGSTFWCVLAGVLSRVVSLYALAIVARSFGRDATGLITLVQTTIQMAGGFAGVGLGMAATQCLVRGLHTSPQIAAARLRLLTTATVATMLLAALMMSLAAGPLSVMFPDQISFLQLLGLSGLLLFFTGLQQYQAGVLAGFSAFRMIAITSAAACLLSIPILALATHWGGLQAIITALTLSGAVSCGLNQLAISTEARRREFATNWQATWAERKLLWESAMPCVLLNLITAPIDWLTFQFLANSPGGIGELGVYAVANQWCLVIRFIPMTAASAILPMVATQAQAPNSRSKKLVLASLLLGVLTSVPLCAGLGIFSPVIMSYYGPDFASRWPVFVSLMISGVLIATQLTSERVLVGFGHQWLAFGLKLVTAAVFVVWAGYAVVDGADGLATSRLFTCLLHAVLTVITLARLIPRTPASQDNVSAIQSQADATIPARDAA